MPDLGNKCTVRIVGPLESSGDERVAVVAALVTEADNRPEQSHHRPDKLTFIKIIERV